MPPIWRLIPGIKSRRNEGRAKVVQRLSAVFLGFMEELSAMWQHSISAASRGCGGNNDFYGLRFLRTADVSPQQQVQTQNQQEFPMKSRAQSFNRESCLFCPKQQFPASRRSVLRAALQDWSLLTFRLLSLLGIIAVSMCLQPQCWNSNHDRKFH